MPNIEPKVVRANQFVLADENGETRATLSIGRHGPELSLWDENGLGRAQLTVRNDGPVLGLWDENGTGRAELIVKNAGPILILSDKNGKTRAELGVSGTESRDGTTAQHSESTLTLFNPEGRVIWQSPR